MRRNAEPREAQSQGIGRLDIARSAPSQEGGSMRPHYGSDNDLLQTSATPLPSSAPPRPASFSMGSSLPPGFKGLSLDESSLPRTPSRFSLDEGRRASQQVPQHHSKTLTPHNSTLHGMEAFPLLGVASMDGPSNKCRTSLLHSPDLRHSSMELPADITERFISDREMATRSPPPRRWLSFSGVSGGRVVPISTNTMPRPGSFAGSEHWLLPSGGSTSAVGKSSSPPAIAMPPSSLSTIHSSVTAGVRPGPSRFLHLQQEAMEQLASKKSCGGHHSPNDMKAGGVNDTTSRDWPHVPPGPRRWGSFSGLKSSHPRHHQFPARPWNGSLDGTSTGIHSAEPGPDMWLMGNLGQPGRSGDRVTPSALATSPRGSLEGNGDRGSFTSKVAPDSPTAIRDNPMFQNK